MREDIRFAISFRLPPEDSTGGFAGIKIWEENGREPDTWFLPKDLHATVHIIDNFDLHAYTTSPGHPEKITLLSIGDTFKVQGRFKYCLGIYRDENKNPQDIVADDPRIYNNGDPPEGFWKKLCRFFARLWWWLTSWFR